MDEIISVPESIKFYFENDANRNAINELVDLNNSSNKKKLNGFSLEELKASNQARLAAMKTQVDFWDFMEEIWDKTWGKVTSHLQEIELDEYEGDIRDFNYVWDNVFYKQYKIADGVLYFSVLCDEKSVSLWFYFLDENEEYNITNDMELSKNWNKTPDDDERRTKEKIAPVKGLSSLSIKVLQDEANNVVNILKDIL